MTVNFEWENSFCKLLSISFLKWEILIDTTNMHKSHLGPQPKTLRITDLEEGEESRWNYGLRSGQTWSWFWLWLLLAICFLGSHLTPESLGYYFTFKAVIEP